MQIEGERNGCSDSGHILAFRKMMEEQLESMVLKIVWQVVKPIVTTIVKQEIVPVAEDLFRRVVKEEIQPLKERLLAGGSRNDSPKEGTLQLKLSDEVSDTVHTSTELKSKNDEFLDLVLVDSAGKIVDSGTESSAKVEITLHNEDGSDGDHKGKPHFSKSVYELKDGVVCLSGLKLAHGKDWTKLCKCKLRARIAQNLEGITVQEVLTAPFLVIDNRIKHFKKHPIPSLLSEVWRLKNIGRNGEPCKRLEKKRIKKLRDFLFWLCVNPEELQRQILRVGDAKWEAMIAHARSRDINEDKRMYTHGAPGEPQRRVVYDVAGELKGVIDESHFVRIDHLSADKKDDARNLLRSLLEPSAFVQRYETFFNDEASLLQQFPQNSGGQTSLSRSSAFQERHGTPFDAPYGSSHETDARCSDGAAPAPENIYRTTERGSSSQSIEVLRLHEPSTASPRNEPFSSEMEEWRNFCWSPNPMMYEYYNLSCVEVPQLCPTSTMYRTHI